eukprot:gnl/Chilomastix_cuspidata/2584.p1 GENE.gnl/Chilomastix_cuspidata/2584~~gnl/Chilomastix_cuspidata/2584.p1  ORF type:complete len:617 (-),score=179.15 gnl/Chilomastix_cuspidata/2584:12-1862(-)
MKWSFISLSTHVMIGGTISSVEELVARWLSLDRNGTTREEVLRLQCDGKDELLRERLSGKLVFGTGGLRGPIGAGFSCMNELTVTQAAQGLYVYLAQKFLDLPERGIAIAYDARQYSREFAEVTAATFLAHRVKTYLFSRIAPTPYSPFATTLYGCCAGVMVTASHNPAADNGYKVYWEDGVQITEPHDAEIQEAIDANPVPWRETEDRQALLTRGRISGRLLDPYELGFEAAYHEAIHAVQFRTREQNRATPLRFGYSAMWGVGYEAAMKAMRSFGFDTDRCVAPLGREYLPDPCFGGCARPNPEEEHNMRRVVRLAEAEGCAVCFANDPDADRLAVAERQPSGEWKCLHGNEAGIVMAEWMLGNWRHAAAARDGAVPAPASVTMATSTVSTKMLAAFCAARGLVFEEVLTGFKWIGRLCREEERRGRHAFYGFEESIGYMCGEPVRDKDGISAVCCFAELAADAHARGETLWQRYCRLSAELGWFRIRNGSAAVASAAQVTRIFANLRGCGAGAGRTYASDFGPFALAHVRDLTTPGFDSAQPDGAPTLPVSDAQMLTFTFACGSVITLRTSGTEPRIKWYAEARGAAQDEAQRMADNLVDIFVARYVRPFLAE